MNILFICNQNMYRSKTAEDLFKGVLSVKSAGLYNNLVTADQLDWADLVLVMEEEQRIELGKRFPKQYMQKRILSLDIPDIYCYNQPELIELLKKKMEAILATPEIAS
ncbi:phosphotyrosine protein phosphatase [Candidatus Woesearchaeota archaeon]|nr:phosphotyrosine protein phosphatase [Candidatus Woesearchaeota archaeon]